MADQKSIMEKQKEQLTRYEKRLRGKQMQMSEIRATVSYACSIIVYGLDSVDSVECGTCQKKLYKKHT